MAPARPEPVAQAMARPAAPAHPASALRALGVLGHLPTIPELQRALILSEIVRRPDFDRIPFERPIV
jgi:hypothetical protein